MTGINPWGRKVPGTGNLARWITLSFWGIVVWSTTPDVFAYLLDGHIYYDDAGTILFAFGALFVLRCPWCGVWVKPDSIVVGSWLVTRRYRLDSSFQCAVLPYDGMLNSGNMDGSGRWIKVLAFSRFAHAEVKPVYGTLTLGAKRAQKQNDAIRRYVDAQLTAV